jgi:hypothetical protein
VVFSGSLSLSSSFTGPVGGPKAFDIVTTLETPFLYDPSGGNLLLDVRNFSNTTTTQFDAHNAAGDSISRVYYANDANAATADSGNSAGLIAQFTFIPEPGTLPLVGLSVMGLLALVRRKK